MGVGVGVLAAGLLASIGPATLASQAAVSMASVDKTLVSKVPVRHAWPQLLTQRPASPRDKPTTGGITGLVNDFTGASYRSVCVMATGPAGRRGSALHLAVSRSNGRYLLTQLRPGRYRLRIANCVPAAGTGGSPPVSANVPGAVTVVAGVVRKLNPAIAWPTLPRSSASTSPALIASKAGSISGRVTGRGRPLAHICAVAIPLGVYPLKPPEPRATTSKTGRYRIRGLKPGRYFVVFRTGLGSCPADANWLPQWYPFSNSSDAISAAPIRVRAGRDTARINGRLKLGGEISGVVRTTVGQPVSGICVNIYTDFAFGGSYIVNVAAVSRQTGHYALHGLFHGSYQIEFSIGCGTKGDYAPQWWRDQRSPDHARWIKIIGRRLVRGVNAALRPGGALTGTVRARTASKRPLAGVCVFASELTGAGADFADAVTAKNGTYRLEGMETGRYQVTFDPTCGGDVNARYLQAQRTVSVTAGRTRAGVNAYLRQAAGISGLVLDQAGKPVDACVTISDRNNDYGETNKEGRYSITGVPPGRYAVNFEDCGASGSLASQWYDNRPNSGSADLVTLTKSKITRHINSTMQPGGTIAGYLTTTSGHPISGQCLAALSLNSSGPSVSGSDDNGFSASNGWYSISDLSPGLYRVTLTCDDGRYADEWFKSQPDATTADYVAVNPGVTTIVSAKLRRAGSITGKVINKAGHPLSGICVNVADARNGQVFLPFDSDSGAATGRRGRYEIGQLTPGRYLVQFDDCNNNVYGTRWYHQKVSESSATLVTVRAGQATSSINGVLTKGGTISGTAVGPEGKPAVDMCVFAADRATGSFSGLFFVGANGMYRVSGLSTGRYELSIYNCGPPTANLASIMKPVRVIAPRSVTAVDVKLAAGGTITGSVTGDSADPGPLGQACVVAVPTTPNGSLPLEWTSSDGRYLISGLPAGTYRVYLADPFCDDGYGIAPTAPQWYRNRLDLATAELVTVAAGRTTRGISATLRPYGGIKGRATTTSHARVAGECVTAVPVRASPDPVTGVVSSPDIAITRSNGRYQLLDLLPGRYKVEFSTGCGDTGFATLWWPGAASAKTAQVITVSNATITKIDATLRR
jgi:protocatechuate 3,4-dioxygenase beta subunit